jgi:hypothetical protein
MLLLAIQVFALIWVDFEEDERTVFPPVPLIKERSECRMRAEPPTERDQRFVEEVGIRPNFLIRYIREVCDYPIDVAALDGRKKVPLEEFHAGSHAMPNRVLARACERSV